MSWNLNEQEIVSATVYTQHCEQELLDGVDFLSHNVHLSIYPVQCYDLSGMTEVRFMYEDTVVGSIVLFGFLAHFIGSWTWCWHYQYL